MSEHRESGINRPFSWLKKTLGITEKTVAPDILLSGVRPSIDVFGWERLAGLEGTPPQVISAQGVLATDIVSFPAVPDGVMRYVIYASCSHDDPGGLVLSLQVRTQGIDIGLNAPGGSTTVVPTPFRIGLERSILMEPGEALICRSVPAASAGQRLFLRMKFVDLAPGEYLPAL